jgi:hypothetical protein
MADTDTTERWFFANLAEVKLAQHETSGAMAIVELVGPPGDMPPLHLHRVTSSRSWSLRAGRRRVQSSRLPRVHRPKTRSRR